MMGKEKTRQKRGLKQAETGTSLISGMAMAWHQRALAFPGPSLASMRYGLDSQIPQNLLWSLLRGMLERESAWGWGAVVLQQGPQISFLN